MTANQKGYEEKSDEQLREGSSRIVPLNAKADKSKVDED